jgi:hypothetical protein
VKAVKLGAPLDTVKAWKRNLGRSINRANLELRINSEAKPLIKER